MSRDTAMLADLIDVQGYASAGKKWKSYPRPWDMQPKTIGKTGGRSRAEVLAILGRGSD